MSIDLTNAALALLDERNAVSAALEELGYVETSAGVGFGEWDLLLEYGEWTVAVSGPDDTGHYAVALLPAGQEDGDDDPTHTQRCTSTDDLIRCLGDLRGQLGGNTEKAGLWQHRIKGGVYEVLKRRTAERDYATGETFSLTHQGSEVTPCEITDPIQAGEEMVCYRSVETRKGWGRPAAMFDDGRFVEMEPKHE